MSTDCKTKKDLQNLLSSFKDALTYWSKSVQAQLSAPVTTPTTEQNPEQKLTSTKLEDPIAELPKLSKLIHAHTTKLGLVFKSPILETNYRACYTELENCSKAIVLLVSLLAQLMNEREIYSKLFVTAVVDLTNDLLTSYLTLFTELETLLELPTDTTSTDDSDDALNNKNRLVSVARIWETTEVLQTVVKSGSAGLLKSRLKETNQLVDDAIDEFEEWVENPSSGNGFDDDPLAFFDDDDDDAEGEANGDRLKSPPAPELDDDESDGEDADVDEELLKFAKVWVQKVKLIKLLVSSLDKSIPNNKFDAKFSSKIDLLNAKRLAVGECIDDLIGSVIYEQDLKTAEEFSVKLISISNKIVGLVKDLNNGDEKKCRWLNTWKVKFLE